MYTLYMLTVIDYLKSKLTMQDVAFAIFCVTK